MSDGLRTTYNYAMYEDKTELGIPVGSAALSDTVFMFFKFSPSWNRVRNEQDLERWI